MIKKEWNPRAFRYGHIHIGGYSYGGTGGYSYGGTGRSFVELEAGAAGTGAVLGAATTGRGDAILGADGAVLGADGAVLGADVGGRGGDIDAEVEDSSDEEFVFETFSTVYHSDEDDNEVRIEYSSFKPIPVAWTFAPPPSLVQHGRQKLQQPLPLVPAPTNTNHELPHHLVPLSLSLQIPSDGLSAVLAIQRADDNKIRASDEVKTLPSDSTIMRTRSPEHVRWQKRKKDAEDTLLAQIFDRHSDAPEVLNRELHFFGGAVFGAAARLGEAEDELEEADPEQDEQQAAASIHPDETAPPRILEEAKRRDKEMQEKGGAFRESYTFKFSIVPGRGGDEDGEEHLYKDDASPRVDYVHNMYDDDEFAAVREHYKWAWKEVDRMKAKQQTGANVEAGDKSGSFDALVGDRESDPSTGETTFLQAALSSRPGGGTSRGGGSRGGASSGRRFTAPASRTKAAPPPTPKKESTPPKDENVEAAKKYKGRVLTTRHFPFPPAKKVDEHEDTGVDRSKPHAQDGEPSNKQKKELRDSSSDYLLFDKIKNTWSSAQQFFQLDEEARRTQIRADWKTGLKMPPHEWYEVEVTVEPYVAVPDVAQDAAAEEEATPDVVGQPPSRPSRRRLINIRNLLFPSRKSTYLARNYNIRKNIAARFRNVLRRTRSAKESAASSRVPEQEQGQSTASAGQEKLQETGHFSPETVELQQDHLQEALFQEDEEGAEEVEDWTKFIVQSIVSVKVRHFKFDESLWMLSHFQEDFSDSTSSVRTAEVGFSLDLNRLKDLKHTSSRDMEKNPIFAEPTHRENPHVNGHLAFEIASPILDLVRQLQQEDTKEGTTSTTTRTDISKVDVFPALDLHFSEHISKLELGLTFFASIEGQTTRTVRPISKQQQQQLQFLSEADSLECETENFIRLLTVAKQTKIALQLEGVDDQEAPSTWSGGSGTGGPSSTSSATSLTPLSPEITPETSRHSGEDTVVVPAVRAPPAPPVLAKIQKYRAWGALSRSYRGSSATAAKIDSSHGRTTTGTPETSESGHVSAHDLGVPLRRSSMGRMLDQEEYKATGASSMTSLVPRKTESDHPHVDLQQTAQGQHDQGRGRHLQEVTALERRGPNFKVYGSTSLVIAQRKEKLKTKQQHLPPRIHGVTGPILKVYGLETETVPLVEEAEEEVQQGTKGGRQDADITPGRKPAQGEDEPGQQETVTTDTESPEQAARAGHGESGADGDKMKTIVKL
ncbi:unnamed protein product [Amoebophrya sp. A25]|nr:unnamed protein product [Amoebophrya sp. A25]|eukprot:GSA25T00008263001.1